MGIGNNLTLQVDAVVLPSVVGHYKPITNT